MPTLLSINNYFYRRGGAEVVFLEHNRLLESIGWDIVPFSMQHSQNLPTSWSRYFVEEIEFGAKYSTWDKLRHVPKVIYSREARQKLSQVLDRVKPDVCHAHNIYHHISPSILGLLHAKNVPVVLTLHDLKIACPAYKMLVDGKVCERCKGGRIYNVLLHRCIKESVSLSAIAWVESMVHRALGSYESYVDRFVVPSRFYLEKLVEWGWDRNRFSYIPNFVEVAAFRPAFEAGKSFLYFGRLGNEKGLKSLVAATAMVGVPLNIAGTGPEETGLRKLANDMGANVTFLGYQSGDALHDIVRSSRAVVVPSEWYENAPLAIMESYALGKPVIGANIGGIPELIRDEETGAIFESGSIQKLASALRRFADMEDRKLTDMGRAGRAWMEAEFSERQYLRRITELYRQLGVRT